MKKALSMLLAGTMAMSLVACSSGNSGSSTTADTTAAAAADTKAEGGDTAAAGASEDYGDYNWNLADPMIATSSCLSENSRLHILLFLASRFLLFLPILPFDTGHNR